MRFRLTIPLLLLLPAIRPAVAQPAASSPPPPILRHARGLQACEAYLGQATMGKNVAVAWRYYQAYHYHFRLLIGLKAHQDRSLFYYCLYAQPTLLYTLASNYKDLFLSLLLAPVPLYEQHCEHRFQDQHHHFNLALALGIELEYFLTRHLNLLLEAATLLYLRKQPYGFFGYQLSLGMGFHF